MSLKNNLSLTYPKQLNFASIILKMKQRVEVPSTKKKIFDKDIAKILNITQEALATMKKRNSIPFEEILFWCYKMDINPLDILYKKLIS